MAFRVGGAAFVATLLSTAAMAHEHHTDNIEAGDAISGDPLVGEVTE